MKRFIHSTAFALSFLLASSNCYATHAAGMDLIYTCLGNNSYHFVCTFYRDCHGINAPDSVILDISSTCGFNDSYIMDMSFSTEGSDTISYLAGLCPSASSECVGGTSPGYEQYIYEITVTLNQSCADYTCGVGVPNRNAAISNLNNPENYQLYVECHLDNTNGLCNNSPVFTNIPLAYGCIDQYWTYNHGAYDPDGDSLAYTLVHPLGGPGQNIPYAFGFGYSPTYPFSTTTGTFDFSPVTGQMGATASSLQIVVISVVVTEFRNGVEIGSSQRDLQVVFQECTDNVPSIPFGIFGVYGGTAIDSSKVTVCPGNLLQFSIVGSDFDAGQVLTFTSNLAQVIPAATFTTIGTNPILGSFTWQTTPGDTGTYLFTLTVTDNACPISGQGVYSYTIIVEPLPVDAGLDTVLCVNSATVQLHATGTAPFLWSNGQYLSDSTSQDPVATLPGAGVYRFILTGAVGDNCQNKDSVKITVSPAITGTLSAMPDSVCAGDSVLLTAHGSGGIGSFAYEWTSDPPGFTSTDSIVIANPVVSTHYIVTITSGECSDKDTVSVNVVPAPSSSFTIVPASPCFNELVTITYTGGGAGNQFTWNFDGGTIISGSGEGPYVIQWQNTGDYIVTLSVTNAFSCTQTESIPVTINPLPVASFSANQIGCVPFTVNFQNTSLLGSNYSWSFGDGYGSTEQDPSHVYDSAGVYDVTLIATSTAGCTDTITLTNYVTALPAPDASFTIVPNEVCANIPVTVTYTGAVSGSFTYSWDFSSGTILSGSGAGPYVVYWPSGMSGSVTLTVTDTTLCSITISQSILVDSLPEAVFTANATGCAPLTVDFQNSSVMGSTYSWDFGDGNGSTQENPSHTYDAGSYNVTLIVTTTAGCSDTLTLPNYVIVYPIPDASFNIFPTELCANLPVAITYTGGGSDLNYTWDFDGGTVISGSGAGPYSVDWPNGGNMTVTLTVTDSLTGCSKTQTMNVLVDSLPVASFSSNNEGCAPLFVIFQNTSLDGVSYSWDFGDGNTSTQQNPANTYSAGSYDVILIVISAEGCRDTLTLTSYINASNPPDASFSIVPTEACANDAVNINYTGVGGVGLTYSWDFGGGNVLSGAGSGPYSVDWSSAGTFSVTITITDSNNCSNSETHTVIIDPLPVASFNANAIGCEPITVNFQNTSVGGSSYSWDLGNGTTSTQTNPSETYSAGTYDVTLIVTSPEGCKDTLTQEEFVNSLNIPIADFSIIQPYNVPVDESQATYDFVNHSQYATTYQWDFGDGSSSTEENPQHHYSTLDTFEVTLIACNGYCCDTIKIGNIIVVSYDEIYFPSAFSPDNDGQNDFFHELGQLGIVTLHYSVYNRWGQVVFETNAIDGKWDGSFHGKPDEVGVYLWYADAVMINGHELKRKGNLTLVR
ncbi:MAG TPA: PKD domain-containing protein [Chitinophagales bacterium]|nr:PKD domain-containing protein [Chitinophagales bacterium]